MLFQFVLLYKIEWTGQAWLVLALGVLNLINTSHTLFILKEIHVTESYTNGCKLSLSFLLHGFCIITKKTTRVCLYVYWSKFFFSLLVNTFLTPISEYTIQWHSSQTPEANKNKTRQKSRKTLLAKFVLLGEIESHLLKKLFLLSCVYDSFAFCIQ